MASNQADAIAAIKPVPVAVQLLNKQLCSDDPAVRKAGLDSITRIGAPTEPMTDLIARLLEHQNWYVRKAAAEAAAEAAKCDPYWKITSEDIVGPFLRSKDACVRRMASSSILDMTATAAIPDPLPGFPRTKPACAEDVAKVVVVETATLLSNPDPMIRLNAVETLARMGERAAPYASSLGALLCDPDLSVRNAVVRSFSMLGRAARGGVAEAGKQLLHQDPEVRRSGRRALTALREHSGEVAAAAVAAQLSTNDLVCKRLALETLGEFGELAVPHGLALADMLEDEDLTIRNIAVRVMISAGPDMSKYVKQIMARLKHRNGSVRRIAVDAMRAMAPMSEPFADLPGKILQDGMADAKGDVNLQRIQILDILGGAGENAKPFISDIVRELEAPDWAVRRAAIEAIQDLGEHAEPIAGEVARRLLHFDPDIRRAAGEALGAMGIHSQRYAHRLLATLDSEEDEDVRRTLQQAADVLKACGALSEEDQIDHKADSPPSPKKTDAK